LHPVGALGFVGHDAGIVTVAMFENTDSLPELETSVAAKEYVALRTSPVSEDESK